MPPRTAKAQGWPLPPPTNTDREAPSQSGPFLIVAVRRKTRELKVFDLALRRSRWV